MAISYGLVSSKGDMGRVYDVNLAAADLVGTIDLTQTVQGVATGMQFTPTAVTITPASVTLSADQVLAANGGAGAAGAYANGAGCYAESLRVTSISATAVSFAKTGGAAAASFRCFIGQFYQQRS